MSTTNSAIIEGTIKLMGDEEQYGSAGKTKRQIVVKTTEQYPQDIPVIFMNERCDADLQKKKEGEPIKIHVNIRGREWINPDGEAKYFLELQGWKVE